MEFLGLLFELPILV